MTVASLEHVADVVELAGDAWTPGTPARLLVEVPHGADRRHHYDALHARLRGPFPTGLSDFFHANTDEGAWDLGLAAARRFVVRHPSAAVRLIRCRIPRTFIDCNRIIGRDPAAHGGGVTAGLHVYVEDPDDKALLLGLHAAYCALVDRALTELAAADGLALVPHTYAPRTVGIAKVEHDIVEQLHRVWAPDLAETWPLRSEVDLITKDADGQRLCPRGAVDRLVPALSAVGFTADENGTYWLHPASRAAELSARYPGRLLCLEVRRDLVMADWQPFVECEANRVAVDSLGAVVGDTLADLLPDA